MNNAKEYWKEILVNTIAGLLVLILPKMFNAIFENVTYATIAFQVATIIIIIVMNVLLYQYKCGRCPDKKNKAEIQNQADMFDKIGITKVVPSTVEGEGSTNNILAECDDYFFFMGIAATKWVKGAKNFDQTMKKLLARNGTVHIIMLNPMSTSAKNMSIASEKAEIFLRDSILKNIKELKVYKDMGLDITIKVYAHMPIFRIAIVDNEKIYVGHYRVNSDGVDLQQLILQGKDKILFKQFADYCNVTWNSDELIKIDFDLLDDKAYLSKLVC